MSTAPVVRMYEPLAWRPPQWSKPAMVSVTVPANYSTLADDNASESLVNGVYTISTKVRAAQTYVFDAVLSLDHEQAITKTHHPVQTGSAVSSHAYIEPAQVVMYVLMSDVAGGFSGGVSQTQAPYVQAWTGNSSKSVSAYQQMLKLQSLRIPLTVTTRLRTYYNMLILKVTPKEDEKTITGARFRLEFEQIFVASTQVTPVSARPDDTASTGLGAVNAQAVDATTQQQFSTPTASDTNTLNRPATSAVPAATVVNVPGAGGYSSVPQQFGNSSGAS